MLFVLVLGVVLGGSAVMLLGQWQARTLVGGRPQIGRRRGPPLGRLIDGGGAWPRGRPASR